MNCPNCNSTNIKKAGKDKPREDGIKPQRYQCRGCGRAFIPTGDRAVQPLEAKKTWKQKLVRIPPEYEQRLEGENFQIILEEMLKSRYSG